MEHGHCASCEPAHEHNVEHYNKLRQKTIAAAICGFILIILYMFHIIPVITASYGFISNAAVAIIALGVMILCGDQYYTGAVKSFFKHTATMDTLIAIGTASAWIYSCAVLLFTSYFPENSQHVYFESAVVIIALVNLGMFLELRARKQTIDAVNSLFDLQPKVAHRIINDIESEVPIAQIQVNDLIRVRPGEQVPVDGVVVSGNSTIDEAMLTGEADLKAKAIGDQVFGGTINKSGSFIFKVTKVGSDTILAQIAELVRKAQTSKPQLARMADQISAIFVPLVMIIAVLTALIWYNFTSTDVGTHMFISSVSVLVIACPCALGLAVPISVMIGISKAASFGILIRDGQALQQMGNVTTVVLDKTGTITLGQPRVINVIPVSSQNVKNVLLVAASLEINSEHPYGKAIVKAAKSQDVSTSVVTNFQAIEGLGILGEINGVPVAVGNASFMAAQLVPIDELHDSAKQSAQYGQTFIYVAQNKTLVGAICITDPIREEAKTAILRLQGSNLQVLMITGDSQAPAQSVADRVGITKILAGVMPQEKVAKIESLQSTGEIIAMIGDGINDAPALAQADVGIAMGSGTDIAMQSADITIMNSNLHNVLVAIRLSRAAVKNMRQNLFAAFIYNIIGIPIAAGILYPLIGVMLDPMLASATMALSSGTVILNANKLRLFNPMSRKV